MSPKPAGEPSAPVFQNMDHGWAWVIAISGFLLHIIVGGHRRSMGLFFLELAEYYDTSKSEASVVVSVFYVTSLCIAPVATMMTKRISVRAVVALGGLAIGVAFVISAFVKSLQLSILTVGCLSGIGNGFLHAPTLVLVGQYFEKRRTFAIGLCLAGGATGAFIFPPVITYSIESYGFTGLMLAVSGMSLQSVIFAMLLRPPKKVVLRSLSIKVGDEENSVHDEGIGEDKMSVNLKIEKEELLKRNTDNGGGIEELEEENGVHLDKCCEKEGDISVETAALTAASDRNNLSAYRRAVAYLRAKKVLRMPAFYLYSVCGAMATEMLPLALYLIPPLCKDFDIDLEMQSLILLIMGAPDLIARLSIGFVADRFPTWRKDMFILLLLAKSVLWLYVTFSPNFIKIMIFAQLVGLLGGAIFTLYLPVMVDAVGLRNISIIFSFSMVLEGILCVILPPLLAYVRDMSGSWIVSYRIMSAVSLVALLFIIYDSHPFQYLCRANRKRAKQNKESLPSA